MLSGLPNVDRRTFLPLGGAALGVVPFQALARRAAAASRGQAPSGGGTRGEAGYGPLRPVRDETTGLPLLHLPAGFRYLTFGWTGDPLVDGRPTPPAHDGMAAFAAGGSRIRLVRNHEVRTGGACEDGDTDNFVRGLTLDGAIFPFARNNVVLRGEKNGFAGDFRAREFAGATYSPDGRWLFVNAQTPGITFAVTGPWADGGL